MIHQYMQMVQQTRMQEIERQVKQQRRLAQAGQQQQGIARLWHLITSII